jgi:glycine/D-amino acid oxidase-like deaminating enzyme
MQEIQSTRIKGFYRGKDLIQAHNLNPEYGVVDAYKHLAPVIDTDQAMSWLMGLVEAKGAKLVTERIHGDLLDNEDKLRNRFGADVIVNATGLASSEIAGDTTCYPIRGCLIRVINDGKDFPKIEDPLVIAADGTNEIVFIVPRNDNTLILGGCTEPHEWNLDLTLDSPIVQRMRKRCEAFIPALRNARLDTDYPLSQGLRPFKARNVRVERELRRADNRTSPSRIIHSYGHGGAGWSLSFGCAESVASLVEEALLDLPPMAMEIRKPWIQPFTLLWKSLRHQLLQLLEKMKVIGVSPRGMLFKFLQSRH